MTQPAAISFKAGARATVPFMIAVLPFGIIYGVLALDLGLSQFQALCFSLFAFAGASQVAGMQLLAEDAPLWIAAGTALVINLRYFMYSASVSVHLRGLSTPIKLPLAYLLTDQSYLTSVAQFSRDESDDRPMHRGWFYFGSGLACWTSWQTGVLIGILAGAQIPASLQLDFGIPMVFIGMAVPVLKTRPALAAAVASAILSVVTFELPLSLGIVAASAGGITIGSIMDWRASQ